MKYKISIIFFVIAFLLIIVSFNITSEITSSIVNNNIDIAVNGVPGKALTKYITSFSEGDSITTLYELETRDNDQITVKYLKEDPDTAEMVVMDMPGYINKFALTQNQDVSDKIDDTLLNVDFLNEENYMQNKRVPIIVSFNSYPGIAFNSVKDAFINELDFLDLNYYRIDDLKLVNAISMEIEIEHIESIAALGMVNKIELNRRVNAILDVSVPLIKAPDVWNLTDLQGRKITGNGITIAIIDTGVDYTHSDLGGCFGSKCKVVDGYDFVNGDADPMDDHGHGTHVASTAAGNGTLIGVAPGAKIYAYKVLNSYGSGSWTEVIKGIERATDPNNDGNTSDHVDIISMSLGGSGDEDSSIAKAVDKAVDSGIVVISAAGNSGTSSGALGVPAAAKKGLAIAATDDNDKLAYFSSRGPTKLNNLKPDLAAPGVSICAAQWADAWSSSECIDNEHTSISGTSMATPHVAGAAALLLQLHPNWNPINIKSALMSTTKDLGLKPWEQGTGRLNTLKMIQSNIVTNPASLSFGLMTAKHFSANMNIKNTGNTTITIKIDAGKTFDENKKKYDFLTLNKTSIQLNPDETKTIKATVNINNNSGGNFYGYITLDEGVKKYRVPYFFIRKGKLRVKVVNGSKALSPSIIAIRNNDLSEKKTVSRYWDFNSNFYNFTVKGGNYTIYALGDSNSGLYYILSDKIEIEAGEEKTLNIDIQNAKRINISREAFDGRELYIRQLGYGIREKHKWKTLTLTKTSSEIGTRDLSFYISPILNESIEKDITISYMAYPKRTINGLSEYTTRIETVTGIDSQYLISWKLHEIKNDKKLTFSRDDVVKYTYIHNIPGSDPNYLSSDYGNQYKLYSYWKYLYNSISLYTNEIPALPRTQSVYITPGDFVYRHYPNINYFRFKNKYDERSAVSAQSEFDVKGGVSYYKGVSPKKGEERTIYHGTPPFIPTYFENANNVIKLNPFLIKGNNKQSFIYKRSRINYITSSGSNTVILLSPKMRVYEDANLIYNLSLSWEKYSLSRYASGNPTYKVVLDIPTAYEIQTNNKVIAEFKLKGSDINPPYLDTLDISPRFELGKPIQLLFSVKDKIVANDNLSINAYYKTSDKWNEILLSRDSSYYSGYITINDSESFDLKITATDGKNNIEYILMPISKKAHNIELNLESNKKIVKLGDDVIFSGEIKDAVNLYELPSAYIKYLLDGNFFDFSRSVSSSTNTGIYNRKWTIPKDYKGLLIDFVALYSGTGIYNSKQEKKTLQLNVPGPDLKSFSMNPKNPKKGENITIISTWEGGEKEVIFKSNYDGSWKEYSTKKKSHDYSYTISGNDTNLTTIGWKFEAKDKKTWNKNMRIREIKLQIKSNESINEPPINVTPNITIVNIEQFDNNRGWGETWKFICSLEDTQGRDFDVRLFARKLNKKWEPRRLQSISNTNIKQNITFTTTFDPSFIGSAEIRCESTSGETVKTLDQRITINKNDAELQIVDGKNSIVNRYKDNNIKLSFKIYDSDRGLYVIGIKGNKIRVNVNNGSFIKDFKCEMHNEKCVTQLNPDNLFPIGSSVFEGVISDNSYKISATEKGNFSIRGTLLKENKNRKKAKRGETIPIELTVTDDNRNKINVDTVSIEYRNIFSAGSWKKCNPKNNGIGIYKCFIKTDNLLPGKYDIIYRATKKNYENLYSFDQNSFIVKETKFKRHRINKTKGRRNKFRLPELNISLDFEFDDDIENQEINFTLDTENLVNKNFTKFSPLDKYLRIEPPENFNDNLTTVELKIEYTDEEVQEKNFDENSLRISFYNNATDEWEVFDPPSGGVNISGNYVWANVTHLSDFGVGGKLEDGSSCISNDQCSSGNCAADYDGSGLWCAPAGNCASNSMINYLSGSTTCYNNNQQTCSSGSWGENICLEGCSAGECIVSPRPPEEPQTPPSTPLSGGGSSESSEGNISSPPSKITTNIPECETSNFVCTEWSICSLKKQTRTCFKKSGILCEGGFFPEDTRKCEKKPLEKNTIEKIIEEKKEPEIHIERSLEIKETSPITKIFFLVAAFLLILIAVYILIARKE